MEKLCHNILKELLEVTAIGTNDYGIQNGLAENIVMDIIERIQKFDKNFLRVTKLKNQPGYNVMINFGMYKYIHDFIYQIGGFSGLHYMQNAIDHQRSKIPGE